MLLAGAALFVVGIASQWTPQLEDEPQPVAVAREFEAPWSQQLCGNFCGAGWCNGMLVSEWDDDDPHCGPDYGPVARSRNGQESCMDNCCRSHDMCCAPGGSKPAMTHGCNRGLVDCINHCETLWSDGILDPEDICRGVIWAAMEKIAGPWCCGRPCPPEFYAGEVVDNMRNKAETVYQRIYGRVTQTPLAHGVKLISSIWWPDWGTKHDAEPKPLSERAGEDAPGNS